MKIRQAPRRFTFIRLTAAWRHPAVAALPQTAPRDSLRRRRRRRKAAAFKIMNYDCGEDHNDYDSMVFQTKKMPFYIFVLAGRVTNQYMFS